MTSMSKRPWPTPSPRGGRKKPDPDEGGSQPSRFDKPSRRHSDATSTTYPADEDQVNILLMSSSSSSGNVQGQRHSSRVATEIRERMRQLEEKYANVFTTAQQLERDDDQSSRSTAAPDQSIQDQSLSMQDMSRTSYDSGTVVTADLYHDKSMNTTRDQSINSDPDDNATRPRQNLARLLSGGPLSENESSTINSRSNHHNMTDDDDIKSLDEIASPPQSSMFFSGNPLEMSSSSGSPSKSSKKLGRSLLPQQELDGDAQARVENHKSDTNNSNENDDIDDSASWVFQPAITPDRSTSKPSLIAGTGPSGNVELVMEDFNSAGVPMGIDVPGENELPLEPKESPFRSLRRMRNASSAKVWNVKAETTTQTFPLILRIPNTAFGVAMGLAAHAMLWQMATTAKFLNDRINADFANRFFWYLAFIVAIMVGLLYIYKLFCHRAWVLQEYKHPTRTHFMNAPHLLLIMLTLSIPEDVGQNPTAMEVLFAFGLVAQFVLAYSVYERWLFSNSSVSQSRPQILLNTLGWFLIAYLGVKIDIEGSWGIAISSFCLGIGVFFYIMAAIAIMNGLHRAKMQVKGSPSLTLLIAPTSIGALVLDGLVGSSDSFPVVAECILGWNLVVLILLLRLSPHFARTPPSFGAYWTYIVPIAVLAEACVRYAIVADTVASRVLALLTICLATFAVCTVFGRMVIHMVRCVMYDGQWGDPLLGIPSKKGRDVQRWRNSDVWQPEIDDMEDVDDSPIVILNNSHLEDAVPFEDSRDENMFP